MAITVKDQKLLSTFPRPPVSPAGPPLPSPGPIYRASDFGFIPVGLCAEDDGDSLYDDPIDRTKAHESLIQAPLSLPTSNAELQLVLDNPSKVYAPGDVITGYVLGWDPGSTQIHIVLEGRAKTFIRADKTQHNDRVPLLYQIFHLRPENQGLVPRFSITIPERAAPSLGRLDDFAPKDTGNVRYWTHDWPDQEPYEGGPGHPLPPSMNMPLRTSTSLASHAAGCGQILYKLLAVRSRMDQSSGRLEPDGGCQVPVRLTTRRLSISKARALIAEVNNFPSNLSVQTAALAKERRLSLREQLRDAFNTSAPTFHFEAKIATPKLSAPGADLKVSASVSVLPRPVGTMYNFSVPDISIVSLNFQIRSYTGIRVLRLCPDGQLRSKPHTFKYSELRTSQPAAGAIFRPKDGGFDNQSCVSTIVLPKTILPSFKTYNLWRSYRLKCAVTFEICGRQVSTETKSDLNIIARPDGITELVDDMRPEMNSEDDVASLQIAQAMVRTGI